MSNTSRDIEDYRSTLERYYEKGLNDGRNEGWELAKKIADTLTISERAKIFGYVVNGITVMDILRDFTPQEALAKLEAYEKEQYEIKVGDIVKDGKNYLLVTKRYNNTFEGMSDEGYLYCGLSLRDCEKTSKHIDLTNIFKQIGGGTNELS